MTSVEQLTSEERKWAMIQTRSFLFDQLERDINELNREVQANASQTEDIARLLENIAANVHSTEGVCRARLKDLGQQEPREGEEDG